MHKTTTELTQIATFSLDTFMHDYHILLQKVQKIEEENVLLKQQMNLSENSSDDNNSIDNNTASSHEEITLDVSVDTPNPINQGSTEKKHTAPYIISRSLNNNFFPATDLKVTNTPTKNRTFTEEEWAAKNPDIVKKTMIDNGDGTRTTFITIAVTMNYNPAKKLADEDSSVSSLSI